MELSGLETWLAFMGSLGQTEGSSSRDTSPFTKRKGSAGCADNVIAKQAEMEELQTSLHYVMAIPYEQGTGKLWRGGCLPSIWTGTTCAKRQVQQSHVASVVVCACVFLICAWVQNPLYR